MPVAVQITGFSFEDEYVLGIMKVLEEKIGYTVEMPPAINCDIKAITERMKKNATKPAKVRDMPDPEGLQ